MTKFAFKIIHQSKKSRARVGQIITPHGVIDTPNFVAVGTNGSLKALDTTMADDLGLQLMFCNTYHLMLQPGTKVVKEAGGLHKFINRKQPLITDSGGFQVFSLAYGGVKNELKSRGQKAVNNSVLRIDEQGVLFRSYRDGAQVLLTPETSVQAQKDLGADIIIPFDELPPYHISKQKLKESLERTHRWEKRSLDYHKQTPNNQAMYAVIHGGTDPELRKQSCDVLTKLSFDGFAIGGSLGKDRDEMVAMLTQLMPNIPDDKPNHLLGIADLPSLDACIPLGIDTFDSSHPTRIARHGLILTSQGVVKILNSRYKNDHSPIDPEGRCKLAQTFTKAYLHHLFKANETSAHIIASATNIGFMVSLMERYRQRILDDSL
jgi:queuine tRNA-ribosyltransferase